MRREDMLVTTYEEAVQWLDEFGHTIQDEQVKKVVEALQGNREEDLISLQEELVTAEDEAAFLREFGEAACEALEEYRASHGEGCACTACSRTEAAMKIKEASR